MRSLHTSVLCLTICLGASASLAQTAAADVDCLTDRETPIGVCQLGTPSVVTNAAMDRPTTRATTVEARGGWLRDTYEFVSKNDTSALSNLGLYMRR